MQHQRSASTAVQVGAFSSSTETPLLYSPALTQRSPFVSNFNPSFAPLSTPKIDSSYNDGGGASHQHHLASTRERLMWKSGQRRGRWWDFLAGRMGKALIVAMLLVLGWELGWLSATAGGSTLRQASAQAAVPVAAHVAAPKEQR